MSIIRIVLHMALLLAGSYLWMRYFTAPAALPATIAGSSGGRARVLLSGVGMVLMIGGASGIASPILDALNVAPASAGHAAPGGPMILRVILGSAVGGVIAGIACLVMRLVLSRNERAAYAEHHGFRPTATGAPTEPEA